MPLTDLACRRLKPDDRPYKKSDEKGLYLLIQPTGSKLWRMAYRFSGKQKTLAFGVYPDVSLEDARARRDQARATLKAGVDPGTVSPMPAVTTRTPLFREMALRWQSNMVARWKPDHQIRVAQRFEDDVFPAIGGKPLDQIQATELVGVVRAVEKRGALDAARRINQNINRVFRLAVAEGYIAANPATYVVDVLKPKPRVEHRKMFKPSDLPEFFARLSRYDGDPLTPLALEFVLRTFVRTIEVRFATWPEIEGDLWRIPPERMKMNREHLVPLPPQVQALLGRMRAHGKGSNLLAPGIDGPMSENTLLFALYRMGYHRRATVHGMRRTASTILNESGLWNEDWVEMQLAHNDGDDVRAAYNSAEYLTQRIAMMRWWNDYLDGVKSKGLSGGEEDDLSDLLS
ncbi:hypothetical protein AEAC466_04180 [Asticcacaulis sp. AC466]|uniref:tyrosine-type recombinase/integrase n=1 Tax=Asticcacaulis sp. AC466 TaxID=1282362 RepID=UPI0003C3AF7C|nr:integrase arm-type DNA-binding domain-containing protein [Asticcacaulis sp. AC466]ESQ85501.1 hypothetical protein AEAC466_04180 [Asticcacaulis sp. AC466]